jgi:hypothetical protein
MHAACVIDRSMELKLRGGDAIMQGKGVYQFVDKYGANVDGYR